MPAGDRTGPMGLGPMTGRAAGYCAGYPVPGYMNPFGGRGYYGWVRGFGARFGGRGWRNWYYATGLPGWVRAAQGLPAWGGWRALPPYLLPYYAPFWAGEISPQQEAEVLRQQAKAMQKEIDSINQRISELESLSKSETKAE